MTVKARVYFVRHGETQSNRDGIIQGQLDTELNEEGREQAVLVAKALSGIPFDYAFTSDLKRALCTAKAIISEQPIQVELFEQQELRERYMGVMQGQPMFKSSAARKTWLETDKTIENTPAFETRGERWWDDNIITRLSNLEIRESPYSILAVTHGGFLSTLVRQLIQAKKLECAKPVVIWTCLNASITIMEVDQDCRSTLVQYSGISHLQKGVVEGNADVIEV